MRVFIINLKRAKDRRKIMQERVNELLRQNPSLEKKLSFEFFEAIDGKDRVNLAPFKEYENDKKANLLRGGILSDSEKACFASHLCLWKKCLELNESIIILEDDVIFKPEFSTYIDELLQSEYDFIRLMSLKKLKKLVRLNEHIVLSLARASGTQGYLLRPEAAKLFLKKAAFIYPLDDYMDKFYLHSVFILCFSPPLLDMHFDESTINMGHKTTRIRVQREILRFVYRIWGSIYALLSIKKIRELKKRGATKL